LFPSPAGADSIEDKILELQEKKRGVIAAAFGEGGSAAPNRLTAEDLNLLFSDFLPAGGRR
jgi:SNF2 family DNA or RNA helicase